jgi:hypothetical protein
MNRKTFSMKKFREKFFKNRKKLFLKLNRKHLKNFKNKKSEKIEKTFEKKLCRLSSPPGYGRPRRGV